VVDPSSYSLPYDFYYITELSKTYQVDFFYSECTSNYEYISQLKKAKKIQLFEYKVSPSCTNKLYGLMNYFLMLKFIWLSRKSYGKIHFIWSVFFPFEFVLFLGIREKLIFTFHNDVPHSFKKKVFWPYKIIMKLASKIVFVSNYTMKNFIKNYGAHSDYHLISHGVMPIGTLSNIQSATNVQIEKKLLFWGRVEEYKGVDVFGNFNLDWPVEIYGKWSSQLTSLKRKLSSIDGVFINDSYLPSAELSTLLSREVVFILPYKDATQSGVLYTLLAYGKVFISSNVGENNDFLIKYGLEQLIFNREDQESIRRAINYAFSEYKEIKSKLLCIKNEHEWVNTMNTENVEKLYGH
jgi:glycosyltransferase involved in cell wall biosynthesis